MNHYIKAALWMIGAVLLMAVLYFWQDWGEAEKGNQNTGLQAAVDKTIITLAYYSPSGSKEVERLINQFNRTNPDHIEIRLLFYPADRYMDHLNMQMATTNGPDVMSVDLNWVTSYILKDWVKDLTSYLPPTFLNPYPKWAKDYAQNPLYGDRFYVIPSRVITSRLIYNVDLFHESGMEAVPPATLEQLKRDAEQISMANTGKRKYGLAMPFGDEWAGFILPLELSSTYSGFYHMNYKNGSYDLSPYKPWLETMISIVKSGGIYPGEMALKQDTALAQFAEGNVGMMYASSGAPALLHEKYKMMGRWDAAMPPAYRVDREGKGALMMQPEPPLAVNSRAKDPDKAYKVWEFLHSEAFLGELYRYGAAIPILPSIRQAPENRPLIPHFDKFIPGSMDSLYPLEPQLWDEFTPNPSNLRGLGTNSRVKVYKEILVQKVQVDEALKKETDRWNVFLNEFLVKQRFNTSDSPFVYPEFDFRHPLGRP